MKDRPLSERERRFVEAYMGEAAGNASKAAIIAGYSKKGVTVQASRLLANVRIKAAIVSRAESDPKVLDRKARHARLSEWVDNKDVPWPSRVRCLELLGKCHGDYIERVEHSGNVSVSFGGRHKAISA